MMILSKSDRLYAKGDQFCTKVHELLGWDPTQLRLSSDVTTTSAHVFCQEETCTDDEVIHVSETVSYLAIEHGTGHKIRAFAQAPPPNGAPHGTNQDCQRDVEVDDGHCE